jgi:hypothetical protein
VMGHFVVDLGSGESYLKTLNSANDKFKRFIFRILLGMSRALVRFQ